MQQTCGIPLICRLLGGVSQEVIQGKSRAMWQHRAPFSR